MSNTCFCGIKEHCSYQIETDMQQHDKLIYEQGYNKALDEAIDKFLEYGCVCVEWNNGLSKEKLVDDVLRQAMGQVVIILEKLKAN